MCNRLLFIIILLITLCSVGCRGAKETEDVAFITAIGLDKAEPNQFKATFQISIPRAGGSPQGDPTLKHGPEIINSITASSLAEAFNLLPTSTSRFANRSHMKIFVISEDLARNGIQDLITPLVRFREYRGTIFLCITKGTAEAFLLANKPQLDYLSTKYWEDMMLMADESSYYPHVDVHEFYLRLKNPGSSPYATYVAVNPRSGEDKPVGEKIPNQKTVAYLAGDIPRSGTVNTIDVAGTAVFSGGKMVGTLDTRETRMLSLLQNRLKRSFFIPDDPLDPKKQINLTVRNGSKPDIQAKLADGRAEFKVNVFLEAEITALPSGINYEKTGFKEQLENTISQVVNAELERFIAHTQTLGSDVFGFGYYLRPYFSSYAELEKTNFEKLYSNAQFSISVTTKIRRTGLMLRSSPYKPNVTTP